MSQKNHAVTSISLSFKNLMVEPPFVS